jgi:hypothetical protein
MQREGLPVGRKPRPELRSRQRGPGMIPGPLVTMPCTSALRQPALLEATRYVLPRFSQFVNIHGRSTLVTREPVSGGANFS